MDGSVVSVSKGVFVFKNGSKSQHKKSRTSQLTTNHNIFSKTLWYQSYFKMWNIIEKKLESLNDEMFGKVLRNLILSVRNSYNEAKTEIPTATLLTGINMPDHSAQFTSLSKEIKKTVSPHVAILYAQDCQTLKHLIENVVNQFVNKVDHKPDDEDDSDSENSHKVNYMRKTNCNFAVLQAWFEKLYGTFETKLESPSKRKTRNASNKLLVVIIPDFENFIDKVIQDFILIVSSYLNILPFVLIFGVATSLTALHKSLPYHVSSKIGVQIFNSQPSTTYLNNVIEHVFFTEDCPFHLGGKVFNLFTDIFLFYDLSVKGFIKNFKFAMLEHFSYGNEMALCTNFKNTKRVIEQLAHEDLNNIRNLPSFESFCKSQSPSKKAKLLENDDRFKEVLNNELQNFHLYLNMFHLFLKCLHLLSCDLPKAPLGKQLRELYGMVLSKNISKSNDYSECFQLLPFQSKDELTSKVKKIVELVEKELDESKLNKDILEDITDKLEDFLERLENATTAIICETAKNDSELKVTPKMDRRQLREQLLEMSKKSKPKSEYELVKLSLLQYLQELFNEHLKEPSSKPFYELFFFNDLSIKKQVIGSHRAAIHTALTDPRHYLQCDCCKLTSDESILARMPDISILYKLHLEYGKLINLYDWLQSFLSIIDPKSNFDDGKKAVKPEFQARFTQAVADLEYLGFIKSSKRKSNHVVRLTWGG